MKVAVSRRSSSPVNAHLGYADYFTIYDISGDTPRQLEKRANDPHCSDDGGDHDRLDRTAELLSDCVAVVAAKIGPCARDALFARGVAAVEHVGPELVGAQRELAIVKDYVQRTRKVEVLS